MKKVKFLQKVQRMHSYHNLTVIANGHWSQHRFNSSDLFNKPIEHFQLIRNCNSYAKSLFYYTAFECMDALAAKEKSVDAYIQYTRNLLKIKNPNISIDDCLESYQCIHQSLFFDNFGNETLRYLCGHQQSNYNKQINLGALSNIQDPSIFSIVGVLEHLDKFIEILECLYPTTLHGITELYNNEQIHSRPTMVNESHQGVKDYIEDLCEPSPYNSYPLVYKEATRIFLERYNYMKSHRSICCRKKLHK